MNKFLIATHIGGTQECEGRTTYEDYKVIQAKTEKEAVEKYKQEVNLEYWCASIMAIKTPRKPVKVLNGACRFDKLALLD